jgi:hypothetical protein
MFRLPAIDPAKVWYFLVIFSDNGGEEFALDWALRLLALMLLSRDHLRR